MKGSKKFMFIFGAVFVLYVVAELNRPEPIDWSITLSAKDKIPYGGYILFNQLPQVFPRAAVQTFNATLYQQLNDRDHLNTAYVIITPSFDPDKIGIAQLLRYVGQGNDVFIAAANFGRVFRDSFHIATASRPSIINVDSTAVQLVNANLRTREPYTFRANTIDEYFSKVDTSETVVLGVNDRRQPNFIEVKFAKGSVYLHAAPLCFSNYFMLFKNNAEYTAKCLSYLPETAAAIYWDEFYKPGQEHPTTPLRFFLSNTYLLWALRLSVAGLLMYVLFEMKRKQRVIPVVEPLQNTSLNFVRTVSSVYYQQRDNNAIATKKINHFLDFLRQRFFFSTQILDGEFKEALVRKSGLAPGEVEALLDTIEQVKAGGRVSDDLLMHLDEQTDKFYKQA